MISTEIIIPKHIYWNNYSETHLLTHSFWIHYDYNIVRDYIKNISVMILTSRVFWWDTFRQVHSKIIIPIDIYRHISPEIISSNLLLLLSIEILPTDSFKKYLCWNSGNNTFRNYIFIAINNGIWKYFLFSIIHFNIIRFNIFRDKIASDEIENDLSSWSVL